MSKFPAAGEFSDNADHTAYQGRFENQLAAAKQAMGAHDTQAVTIAAGAIAPDGRAALVVDTEGAVAQDDLDSIDPTEYFDGSVLILRTADNARDVNVRNGIGGAGNIILADNQDFLMKNIAHRLVLQRDAANWQEIARSYGPNIADERAYLGLGTVAVLDDGQVDALTFVGEPESNFQRVGAPVADSAALGGVAAANYARKDLASQEAFAGSIKTGSGPLQIDEPVPGGSAIVEFLNGGVVAARVLYDDTNDEVVVRGVAPTPVELAVNVVTGALEIDRGDNVRRTVLATDSSIKLTNLDVRIASFAATTVNPASPVLVTLGRGAFFPDMEATEDNIVVQAQQRGTLSPNGQNARFEFINKGSVPGDVALEWEYIST